MFNTPALNTFDFFRTPAILKVVPWIALKIPIRTCWNLDWSAFTRNREDYYCKLLFKLWLQDKSDKTPEMSRFTKLDSGLISCLKCLKTFSKLTNAKTHFKEKHVEETETYPCTVCGKLFNLKRSFQNHLNKIHGISQKMLKNSIA